MSDLAKLTNLESCTLERDALAVVLARGLAGAKRRHEKLSAMIRTAEWSARDDEKQRTYQRAMDNLDRQAAPNHFGAGRSTIYWPESGRSTR